jgi:hypothetical protein
MIKLTTTCGGELWSGFFGINANGDTLECTQEIEIEIEEESLETDDEGDVRPCFAINCSNCGRQIDWPQIWEIQLESIDE